MRNEITHMQIWCRGSPSSSSPSNPWMGFNHDFPSSLPSLMTSWVCLCSPQRRQRQSRCSPAIITTHLPKPKQYISTLIFSHLLPSFVLSLLSSSHLSTSSNRLPSHLLPSFVLSLLSSSHLSTSSNLLPSHLSHQVSLYHCSSLHPLPPLLFFACLRPNSQLRNRRAVSSTPSTAVCRS